MTRAAHQDLDLLARFLVLAASEVAGAGGHHDLAAALATGADVTVPVVPADLALWTCARLVDDARLVRLARDGATSVGRLGWILAGIAWTCDAGVVGGLTSPRLVLARGYLQEVPAGQRLAALVRAARAAEVLTA